MNKHVRRTLKGLLWTVIVVCLLFTAQVSVLAYPSPWFDHSASAGNVTIYSNVHQGPVLESLARGVQTRVEATDIYDDDARLRVYVCDEQGLYNRFARLALVPTHVPGFNLSIFNNSFISMPILERRRATSHPRIKHSAVTGDLEECIAHELVHDYVQERIGFFAVRKIPRWKMEGYVEYQANKTALSADDGATLADRIHTMQTALGHGRAREYYEWNMIVEFLVVERGYSFDQIMDGSLTLDAARDQMMSWYDGADR
jgi:hypothetical protein